MTIGASVGPDNMGQIAPESANGPSTASEAARRKRLAQIPRKYRSVFTRAWAGNSRKAAIRAQCLECVGYQSAETDRCTAPACPLYPYREDRL